MGVDGGTILHNINEMMCESVDWINVAQNRDQWRALVNAAMNLRIL
jgi:hypothetical protein